METRGENIQYQNCIHTHPYTHKHENTYKTTQQQIQTLYFRNAYTDTSTNKYIYIYRGKYIQINKKFVTLTKTNTFEQTHTNIHTQTKTHKTKHTHLHAKTH